MAFSAAHSSNLSFLSTTKTTPITPPKPKCTRKSDSISIPMVIQMASTFKEGQLERPKWAGQTPLSRLVGDLISFKPLSALLKLGARQVLIRLVLENFGGLRFLICNVVLGFVRFGDFGMFCVTAQLRRRIFRGEKWRGRFWNLMFIRRLIAFRIPQLYILIVSVFV